MAMKNDFSENLQEQVRNAFETKTSLRISAGSSKDFYGNTVAGDELNVTQHRGIIDYHPSELVLTARCGTRLTEIEKLLNDNDQILAFDPPNHTGNATFGGTIAAGISGPRRAYCGSARDFVLGTRIVNGKGETLKFGGQVMKNVAGYDASRLMVGAQGTLGVLLDISVKVLPRQEKETTLALQLDETTAQQLIHKWINQGHPISASCHLKNTLTLRLSSTENNVSHASKIIGGEIQNNEIWNDLKNQSHEFFNKKNIWRLSLPPACPPIKSECEQLIEWSGAQRWIVSDEELYSIAKKCHGHATRYVLQNNGVIDRFQPLEQPLFNLHKRIKHAFDPASILNPGRTYQNL